MLRRFTRTALVALVVFTAACAVPLGPGFFAEKVLLEVRFVPGAPPHLAVRSTFTLRNSGNAPLDALDLSLPDEKEFGRQNLRIAVDGAAVSPQPASADSPGAATARIALAAPWPQKSRHSVVVSYDLEAPTSTASYFGLSAESFFLPTQGWFPILRAPKGLFAEGGAFPKRYDVSIFVPQNFLVHASGQPLGKKRRAAETEFRFRFRVNDFNLFLFAGAYLEQKIQAADTTVIFWTLKPLSSGEAQHAAQRITQTTRVYEDAFGPRMKPRRPLWVVDFPASWRPAQPAAEFAFLSSFPQGALINSGQVSLERIQPSTPGSNLSASLDLALAEIWFSHMATPDPDIGVLNFALSAYAQRLALEAQGASSDRGVFLPEEIARFDALLGVTKDTPIFLLQPPVSAEQLRPARQKAILFLFALEEEVGKKNFLAAVKRMVQSLRGTTYGWDELRSAVETESGKDLGEFFRRWLYQPGIPADFRARYSGH